MQRTYGDEVDGESQRPPLFEVRTFPFILTSSGPSKVLAGRTPYKNSLHSCMENVSDITSVVHARTLRMSVIAGDDVKPKLV